MSTALTSNRKKIVGLDSLRFLAFLSIFLYHAIPSFKYGYLGVDFFFVLSSFLLTYLALHEIKSTTKFSRINFFVRRALRIFPLYFLVLIFSFFILPPIASHFNQSVTLPSQKVWYWFFLSNYDMQDSLFALKFLWSIAVEEQFYILFLLASFLFRKHIGVFIAILLIGYFGFMVYIQQNTLSFYTHTLAHFANFALGMTAAYVFFNEKYDLTWTSILFLVSSALLAITFSNAILFNLIISIVFGSIILIIIQIYPRVAHFKLFKYVEFLGKYTYGLYIYSGFIFTFGNKFIPINNKPLLIIIELLLTIIVASISYELFERKFLRLKNHFRTIPSTNE